ncbi:MAG TPA: hypothetical protein VFW44_22295 [Bryobacteraceae bacterium]|nr:hypothetical protein [Bryobacteraceae bacterium]
MTQKVTLVMAGFFLAYLYMRYQRRPKDGPRRTPQQQLKTVKLLVAALLVWLAVSFSLRHTLAQMDGADYEPSFLERVVKFFSK